MKYLLKNSYCLIIILVCLKSYNIYAQTFYTENFNNGCASGCLATGYGSWTVQDNVGGTNGSSPNIWYVSCTEEGIAPPGCGSSCIGDACLHIGADAGGGGDGGASFNETGTVNKTYRLARSPIINGTGKTGIVLQFDFIAYGSASCSNDRAQLWLSDNGGTTWPVGYQFCLTSVCCGACNGYSQGQWTTYNYTLPVAFNNNANIRIGFHWRNDGNGVGTDPSVAIDDIKLTAPIPLPLNLLEFFGVKEKTKNILNWTSILESKFSHFEIQKSIDGVVFNKIGIVNGKGGNGEKTNYDFFDTEISPYIIYYRLKMVDTDGSITFSKIISIDESTGNSNGLTLVSNTLYNDELKLILNSSEATLVDINIFNTKGALMLKLENEKILAGNNQLNLKASTINQGVYFLNIISKKTGKSINEKIVVVK